MIRLAAMNSPRPPSLPMTLLLTAVVLTLSRQRLVMDLHQRWISMNQPQRSSLTMVVLLTAVVMTLYRQRRVMALYQRMTKLVQTTPPANRLAGLSNSDHEQQVAASALMMILEPGNGGNRKAPHTSLPVRRGVGISDMLN
jgi:hypothetical protein